MSTDDELYAQTLRDRVDRHAPDVDVTLDRVVPRARRRRAVARGGLTASALVAVLGVGWGAGGALGGGTTQAVLPAATGVTAPVTSVAPSPAPTPRPTVPGVAVVAEDGTVTGVPGDPWDGERYWYQLSEDHYPTSEDSGPWTFTGPPERTEVWSSRERPGLIVADGDLGTAAAIGPRAVIGTWVVAGQRHEMLSDPGVLPTDGGELEQVVRDSLEPERGTGTDDDKVYEVVRTALREGGLWAADHRVALWDVAAALPGVEVAEGQDGQGRAGQVLRYTDSGGVVHQLVRDASTGLLLEDSTPQDGSYTRYLEQRPSDDAPLEPTLELSGCGGWAGC